MLFARRDMGTFIYAEIRPLQMPPQWVALYKASHGNVPGGGSDGLSERRELEWEQEEERQA